MQKFCIFHQNFIFFFIQTREFLHFGFEMEAVNSFWVFIKNRYIPVKQKWLKIYLFYTNLLISLDVLERLEYLVY